jgi:hypothetical protein
VVTLSKFGAGRIVLCFPILAGNFPVKTTKVYDVYSFLLCVKFNNNFVSGLGFLHELIPGLFPNSGGRSNENLALL